MISLDIKDTFFISIEYFALVLFIDFFIFSQSYFSSYKDCNLFYFFLTK